MTFYIQYKDGSKEDECDSFKDVVNDLWEAFYVLSSHTGVNDLLIDGIYMGDRKIYDAKTAFLDFKAEQEDISRQEEADEESGLNNRLSDANYFASSNWF